MDQNVGARKRSAPFEHVCSLSRENKCPKKDMATPLNQTVTLTQANRLRKRKERDVGQQLNIRTFPKNKGYVAYHDGSWDRKKQWKVDEKSGNCSICKAASRTYCICGVTFEEKINWSEVTDFVRYVRSPTNPILFMTDAADQKGFEDVFYKLIQDQTWDIRFLAITRGIVLGAISGKPDLLHNVRDVILNGSKEDLAARAQEFAERHMFFRAGQAHGG